MALLEVAGVSKIYTTEGNVSVGISDINLMFDKNEVVAITGSSGSGKSTLLKVLGGVENYEEGELYIDGKPTSHYTKSEWADYLSEYISFIFQDYNILESFTVLENVEFALTSIKDKRARHERAVDIVKRVGLEHRIASRGSQLSGGEKQRTVIARAIAKDSPIILADEPTGNLDTNTALDILALLEEISKDKLVIIVTHNYEDVKHFATRHIVISGGKVESDDCNIEHTSTTKVDDYDFKEEHAYIFKEKHKSHNAKGDTKVDTRDALTLGTRRFTSRPKQTVLIVILLILASVIMLFATAALLPNYRNRKDAVVEKQSNRVLVIRNDGATINGNELDSMVDKFGATSSLMYDRYIDIEWFEHYEPMYGKYIFKEKGEPSFRLMVNSNLPISSGNKIAKRGEAVIKAPYNQKSKYKVGDTIELTSLINDQLVKYTATIVGASYYVGSGKVYIEAHPTDAELTCIAPNSNIRIIPITKENNDNLTSDKYSDAEKEAIWETLERFTIKITPSKTVKGDNAILHTSELDYAYVADMMPKVVRTALAGSREDIALNIDKNIIGNDNDLFLEVSEDKYLTLARNVNKERSRSRQISLYFSDSAKAKEAVSTMQNDSNKTYKPLLASDVKEDNRSPFFTVLMSLMLAVIVMLLVSLCLVKIALSCKEDLAIYRTMGIKNCVIKGSTYIQMLLASIPAMVLVVIAYVLMIFTTLGAGFAYMPPLWILYLLLIMLGITAGISFAFNRIVYRDNIKNSLRRVNK